MSAILKEKSAIRFAMDDPKILFGKIEICSLVVEALEVER